MPGATYLSRDPTLGYITVPRRACSHGVLGPPPGFLILQVWEKPKNLHGWPFLLTPVWLWDTLTLLPRLSPGLRSSPMSGAGVSLLDGRLPQETWVEEAWVAAWFPAHAGSHLFLSRSAVLESTQQDMRCTQQQEAGLTH